MVATKLSEVAGKGWGWYSGAGDPPPEDHPPSSSMPATPKASGSSSPTPPELKGLSGFRLEAPAAAEDPHPETHHNNTSTSTPNSSSSIYSWDFWGNDSIQNAAEQTYATVSDYVSSSSQYVSSSIGWTGGGMSDSASHGSHGSTNPMVLENMPFGSPRRSGSSKSLLASPTVLNLFHNPYVRIRGVGRKHRSHTPSSSMDAVRSLISVVPTTLDLEADYAYQDPANLQQQQQQPQPSPYPHSPYGALSQHHHPETSSSSSSPPLHGTGGYASFASLSSERSQPKQQPQSSPAPPPQGIIPTSRSSPSETASQLAEGTLRAFRDVALDEAVELHEALRFWSYRWEHPLLAWLEAGPQVWFSEEGYRHQDVGQKVSQIQAVLARRCATIGDLQQHLLRAGWQRGVAQWGVLGDGGEWATVAGGDGRMMSDYEAGAPSAVFEADGAFPAANAATPSRSNRTPTTAKPSHVSASPPDDSRFVLRWQSSEGLDRIAPPSKTELPTPPPKTSISGLPQRHRHQNHMYYTNVLVTNNDGGNIIIDDPALAEWSVDAMALVRRMLYRAANGYIVLPYSGNWAEGDDQSRLSYDVSGSLILDNESVATDATTAGARLPLWASLRPRSGPIASATTMEEPNPSAKSDAASITGIIPEDDATEATKRIQISDLGLLVREVTELLDVMESVINIQRARRLEKLKPQGWLSRNWYMGALTLPPVLYFTYKAGRKGFGWSFLKYTGTKLVDFFREHVVDPFFAIYDELTKGTDDISDRQARNVAIETLQKMIQSWLDDTYPDMPVKERQRMAREMDISLIEAEKEESMKTIYNINSVIRMSFIEAQFLKKEMMNALLAMDEMRAATNFNLNLAAVTPFVLLVWSTQRAFRFVFYAMLKMRRSREHTYGSFLHTLTEMERLLVMRDNPPTPPPRNIHAPLDNVSHLGNDCVLNADDLGMLMLHIHELRTILWQDRRRFSRNIIRSVAEDLAELAGERGAVSVRQQLQIISRMCRTYPFLRARNNQMLEYR